MSVDTTLPPGSYWIGDPTFVFPHAGRFMRKWEEIVDELLANSSVESDNGSIRIWADPTYFGNGDYLSSEWVTFPVDSELLGIVPQATVDYLEEDQKLLASLGRFFHSDIPFKVEMDNGLFKFGSIMVDTTQPLRVYKEDGHDYKNL